MDIRNRRDIHRTAANAPVNTPETKKTVLIYAAVCCLLALACAVVSGLLDSGIAGTGGLDNMGLRSVLTTGQTVLPIVQAVITACLGLGYHMAILNTVRGNQAGPHTLLEGFRRFGPLLRATFLQTILYIAIAIAAMYLSVSIFIFTPLSGEFIEIMEPLMASATTLNAQPTLDDATLIAAYDAMVPMLWIYAAVLMLLVIPVYFRFRMTMFALADEPRRGALAALWQSRRMLRRNCFALLKLDLTMWWYYLALALVSVICYGDVLLPLVGITLPWDNTFSYYLFYGLALVLQFGIYYFAMNRVTAVYAVAYDALQEPEEAAQPQYPFPTQM